MIDVLVVGGGNAALCAALMAREAGASVLLLEVVAARMARRQLAAHAQPALHARRAAGRARRRVPRRRVLAGPAEGHRRRDQRGAGAARHPGVVDVPAVDGPSRRSLPAVALRRAAHRAHQRVLHGRRQGARQRVLPQRASSSASQVRYDAPVDRLELRDGRFVAAFVGNERIEARACVLAAGGFESNREWLREAWGVERARRASGRQLPDPRHALQHRRAAALHDRRRRRHDRRPDAGAHGRHRRARAAVRRRHLHAHRLRVARRRRQPRRASASTTRARTSGRSATRSGAGSWRSSRVRSRYSIIDAKAVGRFMPPVFPGARANTLPELARALKLDEARFMQTLDALQRGVPARHVRPHGARQLRAPPA